MNDFFLSFLLPVLYYANIQSNPYVPLPLSLYPYGMDQHKKVIHTMQQKFNLDDIYSFPKTMFLLYAEQYGIDVYEPQWELPPKIKELLKKQMLMRKSIFWADPAFYSKRPQAWFDQEQHYLYVYQLENRRTYICHD